ncbi:Bifunctional protein GlmU [Eubacteriaceae bacterium CHKCI005]|nr:Bifunctional protein GlmU [Eubacteriaceae bacterium CHKCI005]
MEQNCAVILAGGEGKRMKADGPKVLCEVLFKPMLDWVIDAVRGAGVEDICVVTGHKGHLVEEHLLVKQHLDGACQTVLQEPRLGTGHAVMQASDFIAGHKGGNVLVLCGDAPLMDSKNIRGALTAHETDGNAATVISARLERPTGYGRIVRDDNDGTVNSIVEEKDASEAVRAIREVNSGAYWFAADELLEVLPKLTNDNKAGEYYLTDTLALLLKKGCRVDAFAADTEDVVCGANTRSQLNGLNGKARRRILENLMDEGVDIPCTDGILVGPDVTVGANTCLLPGTILRGKTDIGTNCVIGPNSLIEDSTVANYCQLNAVQCYQSTVGEGVTAGPFVHIRPGTNLSARVKIGDFVEIKNSNIGEGTKVPHLTYVGDSDVGAGVNFGCGCVTVNYDGQEKNRCTVGDHCFIGCNTNLVAPVTVGDYAYTAAGSTITEPVPENALGIARARQINKPGWVEKKRK